MTRDDFVLAEYQRVSNEIALNEKVWVQIYVAGMVATGALAGLGLQLSNGLIFLGIIFILLPLSYLLLGIWANINRSGSYIRIVLEKDRPGLQWEEHLAGLADYERSNPPPHPAREGSLDMAVFGSLLFFELLAVVLAWVLGRRTRSESLICLGTLVLVMLHVVHASVSLSRVTDRGFYAERWSRYRDSLGPRRSVSVKKRGARKRESGRTAGPSPEEQR